ncbi:hypothetical protein [Rhodococcus sp. IEGM 1318]|uniref:hypothetical protein n=1 Tax=Rhodococcus sp. IEGM 1318 TaxID=3082226 RepID=UPI00295515EB|nr:hypothetical protein [Rhodococcus sp. IEGM 1318]MDV8006781.1 hypothetical protein [Rhodococcus sp. IEGM 1318]
MTSWTAEKLEDAPDKYRITNSYGSRLVMVAIAPNPGALARVVGAKIDAHTLDSPVDAGAHFDVIIKGGGIRVTATDPGVKHVYWDFDPS